MGCPQLIEPRYFSDLIWNFFNLDRATIRGECRKLFQAVAFLGFQEGFQRKKQSQKQRAGAPALRVAQASLVCETWGFPETLNLVECGGGDAYISCVGQGCVCSQLAGAGLQRVNADVAGVAGVDQAAIGAEKDRRSALRRAKSVPGRSRRKLLAYARQTKREAVQFRHNGSR